MPYAFETEYCRLTASAADATCYEEWDWLAENATLRNTSIDQPATSLRHRPCLSG